MYEIDGRIGYSEVDFREKLNIYGIVNRFQDCSTFQSEDMGVGVETLHTENLVWVLSSWNIEVLRYPTLGERITVGTFPYEFRGYFARRNFVMKDENGQILAMADTLWMLLNYKESTPARISEDIINRYTFEEKLPMTYFKGKIKVPEVLSAEEPITVKNSHLDANMHVNNGKFVGMVMDLLEVHDFKRLRVEYRKQGRLDDVLIPYISKDEERVVIVLKDNKGEVYTIMEFSYD